MQWLAENGAAGIIWHAAEHSPAPLHGVASRYPLVALNRSWPSSVHFDSVSVNQAMNITLAVEHLWAQGHRKIATYSHTPGNSVFAHRMEEYRRLTAEKGIRNYHEFQACRTSRNALPVRR